MRECIGGISVERRDALVKRHGYVDERCETRGRRAMLDLCMFAEGAKTQEEIVAVGSEARLDVRIPDGMVTFSPRVPPERETN